MSEFDIILEKMKENSDGWKLNLLNSLQGWNPEKIDIERKQLLLIIAINSLNDEDLIELKRLIEIWF